MLLDSTTTDRYEQMQAAFDLADIDLSVSELHGVLVGAIAYQLKTGSSPDFRRLLGVEDWQQGERSAVLEEMIDWLQQEQIRFEQADLGFELVLPDSGARLSERVDELASWCRGYLLALMFEGNIAAELLPEESREFVDDLVQISLAEETDHSASEDDERSFMEIEEYVKVGVQLVYESLYPDRTESAANSTH